MAHTFQDMTVNDLADLYVADVTQRGAQNREAAFVAVRRLIGDVHVDDVDRTHAQHIVEVRRAEGMSPTTIDKDIRALRSAFNWAGDQELIDRIPVLPGPAPERRPTPPMDVPDVCRRLLEALNTDRMHHFTLFVLICLYTAQSRKAILDLRWRRDIDLDKGRIYFQKMAARTREPVRQEVEISPLLKEVLIQAHKHKTSEYVVTFRGRPIRSVRAAWFGVLRTAELSDLSFYDLRATAAARPEMLDEYLADAVRRLLKRDLGEW